MKSKKYHKEETEREKMRSMIYKLMDENRAWRDRYIGTLMMLSYDGCISDSRAREIIKLNIYEWRRLWQKTTATWADGQREMQAEFARALAKMEQEKTK